MAGVKISALPAVAAPLLTDIYPIVQAGVTYKATLQQTFTLFQSNITGFLPISGGTLTGPLILSSDPITQLLQATTKEYVDTVASGFTVILATLAATTANLNTVYANGAAGVGATLTDNSGTFAAFTVDGVSPALNSRILVKNQTNTFENGVYELTTNGDTISIPYVLTRTTDYDQAPSEIHPGTLVAVNTGTVNASSSWLETATVAAIGTDPILFSQFSFGPTAFLLKANNLSDVASAATSRTNLGLGTVATKTASDNAKTIAAMVNGAVTIGNIAVFSDVTGTIEDSGLTPNLAGRLLAIQKFPASGTYTPSAGVNNALVKSWGGGAGGGSNTNASFSGGGGGAGAYAEGLVPVSGSVTITIGAGGPGAAMNTTNNGTVGGDTSYGVLVIAKGGNGGPGAAGAAGIGLGGGASSCTFPTSGFALNGGDSARQITTTFSVGGNSPGNTPQLEDQRGAAGDPNSGQGGTGGSTLVGGGAGGSGYMVIYEYS